MDQYNFKRTTSPPPYPVKRQKSEPSDVPSQPRGLAYTEMDPAPAPYYNSPSPFSYDDLIEVTSISDASGYRDEKSTGGKTTPIYISSSPIYQEATRQQEVITPIYISSSPVQTTNGSEEIKSSPYAPSTPLHDIAWHHMQNMFHTPTPSHNFEASPIPDEAIHSHWTPTWVDAPLIWASEVDIQILPSSPPYSPTTPTPTPAQDLSNPICLVPVPQYDHPEQDSLSPRYQTLSGPDHYQGQEDEHCRYPDQDQDQQQDQEHDTFLFQLEMDPEIQQLETLDSDYLWRQRWVYDYGSDADDEGSLGGY